MAKIRLAIWPSTINGQSQFTPTSSDTNILKSEPNSTRNMLVLRRRFSSQMLVPGVTPHMLDVKAVVAICTVTVITCSIISPDFDHIKISVIKQPELLKQRCGDLCASKAETNNWNFLNFVTSEVKHYYLQHYYNIFSVG